MRFWLPLLAALVLLPGSAAAEGYGTDEASCTPGSRGPAIRATIVGLKDRAGRLKLELYPANETDFLRDDTLLVRENKTFRRIWAQTPQAGEVQMCIRAPAPGRYALLFTHDRDGKNKFNFWRDGAGFPANTKLGRSRPKLAQAIIDVGRGVTTTTIRAQYLRGLSGFGPVGK
jgi:uncharacterized protein (DUF2141 family)